MPDAGDMTSQRKRDLSSLKIIGKHVVNTVIISNNLQTDTMDMNPSNFNQTIRRNHMLCDSWWIAQFMARNKLKAKTYEFDHS